ncbi:unnamed protein product [Victoria cruziana]
MWSFGEDFCHCWKPWTWEENERFELYLARFPDNTPDRWHTMASFFEGRSPSELKLWYEKRPLSRVWPLRDAAPLPVDGDQEHPTREQNIETSSSTVPTSLETKRKRGSPWTEEEHRRFLSGLERYGKGDWQSISRNVVITKTATQVASHAQKYFLRQAIPTKERKRASIHDISSTPDRPDSQEFIAEMVQAGERRPVGNFSTHGGCYQQAAAASGGSNGQPSVCNRKKCVPWTEEEHRRFLAGLEKYGKGDWKSISRFAVITKTPTQVASHAQKYYLRLSSEKKRSSIHDITTVDDTIPPQTVTGTEGPSSSTEHRQMPRSTFLDEMTDPDPDDALWLSGFVHFDYDVNNAL